MGIVHSRSTLDSFKKGPASSMGPKRALALHNNSREHVQSPRPVSKGAPYKLIPTKQQCESLDCSIWEFLKKGGGPRDPKGYRGILRGLYRAPLNPKP